MSVKYTDKQIMAINTRNSSILVAAAAGSGKTSVLVERTISMIKDQKKPVNIESLLIVTFTEAAASQMRQRISQALTEEINKNPHNEYLKRQLAMLNKAPIMTIHSFCMNVIRSNCHLTDIDPNFRIADIAELEIIKNDIIEDIFEQFYSKEDNKDFLSLSDAYSENKNDKMLKELVLEIYKFIQSCPYPIKWLKESLKNFKLDENKSLYDTLWGAQIKQEIEECINLALNSAQHALNIIKKENAEAATITKNLLNIINDINILKTYAKNDITKLYEYVSNIKFGQMRTSKNDTISEETKLKIQDIQKNEIKKSIYKIKEKIIFLPEDVMKDHIKKLYPLIKALIDVIIEFDKVYKNEKKERLILDFNDLEHYCLEILTDENGIPTNAAHQYQNKFHEIITDEYQDSNTIQELILSAVSKKSIGINNRFMVGDIKQCIYKFRLANPELFMEKYNTYKTEYPADEIRIDLSENFRSHETVIESVNCIFKKLMSIESNGIKYDKNQSLNPAAVFPEYPCNTNTSRTSEFLILDSDTDDDTTDEIELLTKTEREALLTANKIKEMINNKFLIYDNNEKKYRQIQYKDIVILLRTTKLTAHPFADTLTQNGIPALYDTLGNFFSSSEIMTIISILQIIDNPRQDIPLISVMYCPIYSFSIDELTQIKIASEKVSFYDCITYYISDENKKAVKEIKEKIIKMLDDIDNFRARSLYTGISELLQYIYDFTGYYNYAGLMSNGAIRQGNLKQLQERAENFENSNMRSIFMFIKYLEKSKERDNDFTDAKILSKNEDTVRIMSIHKSKGLEFPVVFVCLLGRNFYMPDTKGKLIYHQELGFGPMYVDTKNRVSYNTIARYAISSKIKKESLAEEIRLLYVAFTRAKEKLILTASIKNAKETVKNMKKFNEDDNPIPAAFINNSSNAVKWIIAALPKNKSNLWNVSILSLNDLSSDVVEKTYNMEECLNNIKNIINSKDDLKGSNEINKILSWTYKYKLEQILPSKVSISEIKRNTYLPYEESANLIQEEIELKTPEFLISKKALSSAQQGTAIHTVMEHIDFNMPAKKDFIEKFIDKLKEKSILSLEEIQIIDINKIILFLNSPLCERIKKSKSVKKETPFVMGLSPYEVYKINEYKNIEGIVLVHGIIDLYFEENENIILVDYKTDKIRNNLNKIKKQYEIQLSLYKKAIERNTGKTVKQTILYMFDNNSIIEI